MRSMTGMSRKRPGPFGSGSRRPRRKMTPRSYSRAILTAANRNRSTTTDAATRAISPTDTPPSAQPSPVGDGMDPTTSRKPSSTFSTRTCSPGTSGEPSARSRPPELAVERDEPVTADHTLARRRRPARRPRRGRRATRTTRVRAKPSSSARVAGDGDRDTGATPGTHHRPGRRASARRARTVTAPATGQRAVGRHERLRDEERGGEDHQQQRPRARRAAPAARRGRG